MKSKRKIKRNYWISAAFILILGILAACNSGSSNTLHEIPKGFEGPQLISVSSNSATIRFDTGVPTVCNAPYGQDTNYGDVATIPMLSGATKDHVLTFSGLEAGTIYHYKIIATDNQGNVYQSGDFTFTTDLADENAQTNWLSIASGAVVVDVSSNFNGVANDGNFGANSAVDENRGTEWSSAGDGNAAFIELALVKEIQLSQLVVHTRSMSNDTSQVFSFNVVTEKGESFGPFELPDANSGHQFDVSIVASRLRFEVIDSNGGNTGFVEIEGFGIATE